MKFPFPSVKMVIYLLIVTITSALIIGAVAYFVAQYLYSFVVSGQDVTKDPFHLLSTGGVFFIMIAVIVQGVLISIIIGEKIIKEPKPIDADVVETAVSSLRFVTSFLYILIFSILGITAFLLLSTTSVGLNYLPILVNLSAPSIVSLSVVVITLVVAVIAMGELLLRKDFHFNVTKMCIDVLEKRKNDEDKRMHFLRIALNSYNRFIERNFRLEFETAKVFSMIVSNKDKKAKIKEIVDSFDGDDKFKPIAYLSEIGSINNSEPFLVKQRLWTTAKEVGTFLAVIIPVFITVVQLIQSYVKFIP